MTGRNGTEDTEDAVLQALRAMRQRHGSLAGAPQAEDGDSAAAAAAPGAGAAETAPPRAETENEGADESPATTEPPARQRPNIFAGAQKAADAPASPRDDVDAATDDTDHTTTAAETAAPAIAADATAPGAEDEPAASEGAEHREPAAPAASVAAELFAANPSLDPVQAVTGSVGVAAAPRTAETATSTPATHNTLKDNTESEAPVPGSLDSLLFTDEAVRKTHDDVAAVPADTAMPVDDATPEKTATAEEPHGAAAKPQASADGKDKGEDSGEFDAKLRALRSESDRAGKAKGFPAPIDIVLQRGTRETKMRVGPMMQLTSAAAVLALVAGTLFIGGRGEAPSVDVAAFEARITDLESALAEAEQRATDATAARTDAEVAAEEARKAAAAAVGVPDPETIRAAADEAVTQALAQAKAESEVLLTALERERDGLRSALAKAEAAADRAEAEAARAEAEVSDKERALARLRQSFDERGEELADLRDAVDETRGAPAVAATSPGIAAPAGFGAPSAVVTRGSVASVSFGASPQVAVPTVAPQFGSASPSSGISTAGLGASAPVRPRLPGSDGPALATLGGTAAAQPASAPAAAPVPASQPSSVALLGGAGVPAAVGRPAAAGAAAGTLVAAGNDGEAEAAIAEDAGVKGVTGGAARGDVYLQAGVFVAKSYGVRLRDNLIREGIPAETLPTKFAGKDAIRVRVGPLGDSESRVAALSTLRSLGVYDAMPVAR